jgi:hypothetical protein
MNDLQVFYNYLDGKYPDVFGVSIDKVSILGNWCYWKGKHPFQRLLDMIDTPISIRKGDKTPEIEGYIFDKIWFKTNDKMKFKNVRDFKLEFNPKRISSDEDIYMKENILPLLKNVGFTRLDFAFDVEEDLADYVYFAGNSPKKIGKYIGKNGKLETMYIGSKESEWHVCIYDKKKEKMKELSKEERALENGKEYDADLTDWEREQLLKRKHWWRIEIRVRREKADPEITEDDLFQSLHIVKPCFSNEESIQDQALIFFLNSFPEKIEEMNYRPKKRAQSLLLNTSEFDLVSVLRLGYVQHKYELEIQLKDYLSSASLKAYEIEKIYTLDEKIAMQHGKEIETKNLTFSSNYALRRFHKGKRPSS